MSPSHTGPQTASPPADGDFGALPEAWVRFLNVPTNGSPDVDAIYRSGQSVLPARHRVFRAFHLTNPSAVRVVLLGQDPYPNAQMADGLAFSQPGAISRRSALHRLFLNLEHDPAVSFNRPANGDLAGWASNGVLLLNAALTMDLGERRAHRRLWVELVTAVVGALGNTDRPIAFVLLGRDAIDLARPELRNVHPEAIITAAHPMAGASGRERRFRDARVFSEANSFLVDRAVPWGALNASLTQPEGDTE